MELNYKTYGQGEPLLILHGLFGTLDNWQTIAKKLADHYTVYVPDQRNHGRSPHLPEINYPIMAEDLKAFMESHWIYKAHLLGHSMGGKVAMQFALHYPDMTDKLIVVDIAPKAYEGGHDEIFDALRALDLDTIAEREDADAFLQNRIPDKGVRQFLMKNLTRNKEGGYEWKMNLPVLFTHYRDLLAPVDGDAFEGPSLFLRGEWSPYVLDSDLPAIRKLFPHSVLDTIGSAGHWVHADQPEALLTKVMAFLGNS
ncbi:MAG: alpha/beta fold hydrolase [Saprospiraceae bacterium]|nr:alpha/beta fold hydrolase [Saprospiraceae bacterium]